MSATISDATTPLLCVHRPYVEFLDGSKQYVFSENDVIGAMYCDAGTGSVKHVLDTIAALQSLSTVHPELYYRLPGTVEGELSTLIASDSQLAAALEQEGAVIKCDGEVLQDPAPTIAGLRHQTGAQQLSQASIRRIFAGEPTLWCVQEAASVKPRIGRIVGNPNAAAVTAVQQVREHLDVANPRARPVVFLGLFDSTATTPDHAAWLKQQLPRCLIPEFLSTDLRGPEIVGKLQNCIMQLDRLFFEEHRSGQIEAGKVGVSCQVAVHIPTANVLFLISLGQGGIVAAEEEDGEPRIIVRQASPLYGSVEESERRLRSGASLDSSAASLPPPPTTRGFGYFDYKTTAVKQYSRANGPVSALASVLRIVRKPGETMCVALCDSVVYEATADAESLRTLLDQQVSMQQRTTALVRTLPEPQTCSIVSAELTGVTGK